MYLLEENLKVKYTLKGSLLVHYPLVTARGLLRAILAVLQALQREHPFRLQVCRQTLSVSSDVLASAFCDARVCRQQLVVEATDGIEPGQGLCWVRDDLQDVALQRQDENSAPLHRVVESLSSSSSSSSRP